MKYQTTLLCIFAAYSWTHSLHAESNSKLRHLLLGSYGMTSSQSCVRTPFAPSLNDGIDANTRSLLTNGESISAITSGIMSFAEDGTVSVSDGQLTEILFDQTAPGDTPVSAQTAYSCFGDYELKDGQKISISLDCEVESQGPGIEVTVGPFNFEGYVGKNARTLQISMTDGTIQDVDVSVNGTVVQRRQRICVQNASLSQF